jgi:hypothetical protein
MSICIACGYFSLFSYYLYIPFNIFISQDGVYMHGQPYGTYSAQAPSTRDHRFFPRYSRRIACLVLSDAFWYTPLLFGFAFCFLRIVHYR